MKVEEWDKPKVLELFKKYRFNRYIERFCLQSENQTNEQESTEFETKEITTNQELENLIKSLESEEKILYHFGLKDKKMVEDIIPKEIISISIFLNNIVYYYEFEEKKQEFVKSFKHIFEEKNLVGYELSRDYILLKQEGITPKHFEFDVKIAAYLLNPVSSKYPLDGLSIAYTNIDITEYLNKKGVKEDKEQLNLFDVSEDNTDTKQKQQGIINVFVISKLEQILKEKLIEEDSYTLFCNIEMPLVKVLADMQYIGMKVEKEELISYGSILKKQLEELTKEIYELVGEEFNINSPKQLGEILFEKLKLPYAKKTKNGYSTDVDTLEKIKKEHRSSS